MKIFPAVFRGILDCPDLSTLRLDHEPGERVQIDFADGIPITDALTCRTFKTQFFCAVLPFSSYTFGEFLPDQKLKSFIQVHERMWAYFGGVTPYVVLDNLKAGVKKDHRYDPELNPTYCDYGNHTGFAGLAARPYTPRDKACIEATIGAIQRSFYQQVRDQSFYSLDELNRCFREFLQTFNHSLMKDYGFSRAERFSIEQPKLLPLAATHYKFSEWRTVKVHPDSCIQVQKCLYSVPYRYLGQILRVKITDHLIEVYNSDLQAIACHKRLHKVGQTSINEEHLPATSQQTAAFDIRNAQAKAKAIGPKTAQLIDELFHDDRPLRHLRRVMGILRLRDQGIRDDALEYAASQALSFQRYHLAYIRDCSLYYQANGGRLRSSLPVRDLSTIHLHKG